MNDQRKLYVSLTPAGQELYDKARQEVEEGYQKIELAFSPEKMQQLTALLDELIALESPDYSNIAADKRKSA